VTIKASVYIATSLDGFIARTNGDLDWLASEGDTQSNEDYGYQAFIDTVDVIVMGRNTFEKVLTFDQWPYSAQKVVVLSSRSPQVPMHLSESVELLNLSPRGVIEHLEAQGATHLYIDGGQTIQRFLNDDLITDLILTRIPILIGSGIPLFGPLKHDIRLAHIETRQFANGYVQSRYRLAHQQAA
jgi:dihydrofolate reductase